MKKLLSLVLVALLFAAQSFAACTAGFTTSGKSEVLSGIHDLADTYKLAFYTDSATYSAATTAYAATNEVSGTGYSAGGFIIADNGSTKPAPTVTTSGTKGLLDFTDLAPTTITFTAASTCAVLYNATESNKALAVYTFSSVQPSAGTLTIDFTSGSTTSPLRIAELIGDFLSSPVHAGGIDGYVRIDGVEATLE